MIFHQPDFCRRQNCGESGSGGGSHGGLIKGLTRFATFGD
jgi:hypothetical protein